MRNFIAFINDYIKNCDSRMMALVKLCLGVLGLLAGLTVPREHKKKVAAGGVVLLLAAYIPLVADCVRRYSKNRTENPVKRWSVPATLN